MLPPHCSRCQTSLESLFMVIVLTGGAWACEAFAWDAPPVPAKGFELTFIDPEDATVSSKAVVVKGTPTLAHTCQLLPLDEAGRLVGKGKLTEQVERLLRNLELLTGSVQSQADALVKLNFYVVRDDLAGEVTKILGQRLPA